MQIITSWSLMSLITHLVKNYVTIKHLSISCCLLLPAFSKVFRGHRVFSCTFSSSISPEWHILARIYPSFLNSNLSPVKSALFKFEYFYWQPTFAQNAAQSQRWQGKYPFAISREYIIAYKGIFIDLWYEEQEQVFKSSEAHCHRSKAAGASW